MHEHHEHEGEHCACGASRLPEGTMFIVGAQVTSDHDMLPQTVVIVSRFMEPEAAMAQVASKIVEDLDAAGIDVNHAEGAMHFVPVTSWEQFAEMKLPADVKMKALAAGITNEFLHQFCRSGSDVAEDLASLPWLPEIHEPSI